ncbi:tape measure protein [Acinetobacter guillouiae]|uniref:tape measure protein n=1 Tax=Acinetobacter guillouiae TaxID=106649 RepID=UPI0028D74927|nr:tape measure protein [Acinetobacter guillouiae]
MEKQLALEALKLYAQSKQSINAEDWNIICEFAPKISEIIAKAIGLSRSEVRSLIFQNGSVEIAEIENRVINS